MTNVKFVKFSRIRKSKNNSYHCSPNIEKYYKHNFDLVRAQFQGWILCCKWPKYFEYCTNFEHPDHSVLLCDVDGGTTPTGPHYKAAVIPPNNKQQQQEMCFSWNGKSTPFAPRIVRCVKVILGSKSWRKCVSRCSDTRLNPNSWTFWYWFREWDYIYVIWHEKKCFEFTLSK